MDLPPKNVPAIYPRRVITYTHLKKGSAIERLLSAPKAVIDKEKGSRIADLNPDRVELFIEPPLLNYSSVETASLNLGLVFADGLASSIEASRFPHSIPCKGLGPISEQIVLDINVREVTPKPVPILKPKVTSRTSSVKSC